MTAKTKTFCNCVLVSTKQKPRAGLTESNQHAFFINHIVHVILDVSCKSYLFHFFKPARFKNKNWVIRFFIEIISVKTKHSKPKSEILQPSYNLFNILSSL